MRSVGGSATPRLPTNTTNTTTTTIRKMYPTTPKRARGDGWHRQWEDRTIVDQNEKLDLIVSKIENQQSFVHKAISLGEEGKAKWEQLHHWAAERVLVEGKVNEHNLVMTSWKAAMTARYSEMKNQIQEMDSKLDYLVKYCEEEKNMAGKVDKKVMDDMADRLCEKICSFFEKK
jgi:hypothetical protein